MQRLWYATQGKLMCATDVTVAVCKGNQTEHDTSDNQPNIAAYKNT
jgi:hypothetical protein